MCLLEFTIEELVEFLQSKQYENIPFNIIYLLGEILKNNICNMNAKVFYHMDRLFTKDSYNIGTKLTIGFVMTLISNEVIFTSSLREKLEQLKYEVEFFCDFVEYSEHYFEKLTIKYSFEIWC